MHTISDLFRKCTVGGTVAVALVAISSRALAQVDVGLSPMRVEFPAVPGKTFAGSLVLHNSGKSKVRMRAEMVDFYVDQNMTPQFIPNVPAEADYSCQAWLSANPMELELEASSQSAVRFSVRVPAGAMERSYHCALAFRTLPSPDEISGTAMRTAVRLVTVVYATVGKPLVTGVIRDLKLERTSGNEGSWRGVVALENSGLMLYRPAGELAILDGAGKTVESVQLTSFPALPKRTQRYLLPLKSSLVSGEYTLRARIEIGGEIQEASTVVTVGASSSPAAAPAKPGQ